MIGLNLLISVSYLLSMYYSSLVFMVWNLDVLTTFLGSDTLFNLKVCFHLLLIIHQKVFSVFFCFVYVLLFLVLGLFIVYDLVLWNPRYPISHFQLLQMLLPWVKLSVA